MNPGHFIRGVGCALLLALWATAPHLAAQESPLTPPSGPDGRVPITLVLTSGGESPMLLRRAAGEPRNVVLLDSATVDAQQLSDAVFHLLVSEAQDPHGRRRADDAAQRVRSSTPHPVYPWAGEALQRLRVAARRPIPGVGAGRQLRSVQIWVRPLRGVAR